MLTGLHRCGGVVRWRPKYVRAAQQWASQVYADYCSHNRGPTKNDMLRSRTQNKANHPSL